MTGNHVQLLLLSESPSDALLIGELLARLPSMPTSLCVAETLAAGLEYAAGTEVDVFLLGLGLPDAPGLQGFQKLHQSAVAAPIILLARLDQEPFALQAVQAGAFDYLILEQLDHRTLGRALTTTLERELLQEQLGRMQRVEAVGRLARTVAHELNNYLTIILGESERLLADPDSATAHAIATVIRKAAQSSTRLTARLMAFHRREHSARSVFDVNSLLGDLHKYIRRLVGDDIEIVFVWEPGNPQVVADPVQIEQIILNLAVNSRDAMPDGGKLVIETRRSLDGAGKDWVEILIRDTGTGMDSLTLARIFERTFTTKQRGKKTGIGLAEIADMLTENGGKIDVASRPNQGTVVTLALPVADHQPDGKTPPKDLPRGSETLLVVDDAPEFRTLIRSYLVALGYHVLEAGNPAGAIVLAQEHKDPIHLALIDLHLPQLSGRELAEKLIKYRPTTKHLFLSGYTDSHGLPSGAAFLGKPFHLDLLARRVRACLDEKV